MPLQSPKRTSSGFLLTLTPAITSPPVQLAAGLWTPDIDWCKWATDLRVSLIDELVQNSRWFSKPPRREALESLFSTWVEGSKIICNVPAMESESGSGSWSLDGLLMTAGSITPVWSVKEFKETVEPISFFDGDSGDEREIKLEDIEADSAPPTQIRNREWETRKFLGKERVREARLKAQIAARMAAAEEARYYRHFGDLDDGESHFSEYDLTESEPSSDEESVPNLT